jgi:hypothetical protein
VQRRLAKKGHKCGAVSEKCLKAAAPVGSTSAWAEVTASGAGRLCDEQNFRALGGPRVYKDAIRGRQNGNPG